MDVTRERISRILELREIFLSVQTGFSLVNAAVVCAILASITKIHVIFFNHTIKYKYFLSLLPLWYPYPSTPLMVLVRRYSLDNTCPFLLP